MSSGRATKSDRYTRSGELGKGKWLMSNQIGFLRKWREYLFSALGFLTASLLLSESALANQCAYHFEGQLQVEHQDFMRTLLGRNRSNLANVEIRLQGKGVDWTNWVTSRTDSQGRFTLVKTKKCAKREFRILVRFDSDELSIFHENSTDQIAGSRSRNYIVWAANTDQKLPVIQNQISIRFRENGQGDTGAAEPRGHAEIWVLYRRVIAHMASYGSGLGFNKRVKVKHPHVKGSGRVSYANPLNDVIYLVRRRDNPANDAGRNVDTMIHELMHIWAYQHSVKENRMASYLLGHLRRGTHGLVERTHVAFHEGFAEWAKDRVMHDAFGRNLPPVPSRRASGAASFSEVEFRDEGWMALFRLLDEPVLKNVDFSRESGNRLLDRLDRPPLKYRNCRVDSLPFPRLLKILERGDTDIKASQMNWDDFFREAVRRKFLHQRNMAIYRAMLDPAKTATDVYAAMCDPLVLERGQFDPDSPIHKAPTRPPISAKPMK